MLTATRYHDVSAGHRVLGHENKCRILHGHNYRVHFTCMGELDPLGRVIDFSCIKDNLCSWLDANWDHKTLLFIDDPLIDAIPQDHVWRAPFNPTAENMALYLLEVIGPIKLEGTGVVLIKVRIDETAKCSAEAAL